MRGRCTTPAALVVGLLIGWLLGAGRSLPLKAGAGDHPDAPVALTAPVAIEVTRDNKTIENDAVFYLNYAKGYLLAAVPMPLQSGTGMKVLSDFAQRDLLQDFPLPPGTAAHFTMTAGTLGAASEGWAPLYVFESTTGQMVAYRVLPQNRAGSSAPVIQPIERRTDPRFAAARARPR